MFINFIETAKLCLELRNFNAVMAIVVAALGCAPVRRLHKTKELVPKEYLEQYAKMEILMDTKDNYKRYRQALATSPTPSVPYFGIYMKDLTFIAEGNPDFFKGGLINLTKRRQIYLVIDEIRRFQKDVYNFQEVRRSCSNFSSDIGFPLYNWLIISSFRLLF
ncbi:PREDICTED: ras guanine nucleotide exchange factor J-like [Acropora digitifera]|uniref:ras guanine nucleotide exchange factor J-like n=1 Tax=Acropora digitifera TaxID=70779 RepID=UPI00077B07B4|nr:PREDICTED: ras guanine nucleotide exchange factor J-like [Acropora digitifera]